MTKPGTMTMVEARKSQLTDEEALAVTALVRGSGGWKHAGSRLGLSARAIDNALRGRARATSVATLQAAIRSLLASSPDAFLWRGGDTWVIPALLAGGAQGAA